ncbi:hypothetical protein V8E55_005351 [Tylopilus felleus]
MIWTILSVLAFTAASSSLPLSAAVEPGWNPSILYPNSKTEWLPGRRYDVVWDNSNPTSNVNPDPSLYLMPFDGPTVLSYQLAKGFDMHSGRVKITVPDVDLGIWKVVLYGDGSQSEPFIIGGPL